MRNSWLFIVSLVLLVLGVYSFVGEAEISSDFAEGKRNIVLRNIGHELLLSSGDNTARVLPIENRVEGDYLIHFETELEIKPDTVMAIVQRNLASSTFPAGYMVNVYSCDAKVPDWGYYGGTSAEKDILACSGRVLPKDCYFIQLTFEPEVQIEESRAEPAQGTAAMVLAAMTFLLGLWRIRRNKQAPIADLPAEAAERRQMKIGRTILFPHEQYLMIEGQKIALTEKETQVLAILAEQPNQVVERSRLRQEIWGDDGTMISRSLDMFISKLRKKIKPAEELEIVNVRGKGWLLEVVG